METAEEIADAMPIFKKRNLKKSTIRKRPATTQDSSSGSEYSSADEDGQRIKKRQKAGGVIVSSNNKAAKSSDQDFSTSKFTADRTALISANDDATKQSNWYEENNQDLSAKNLLGTTRARPQKDENGSTDGNYKGSTRYTSFINKNPDAPNKTVGPVKAPTNIRTITVTDYSPDVCKDYKQTGFCGFGDGCKFLHAREDYKQGWQLDKEWETVTKGKKVGGTVVSKRDKGDGPDMYSEEEEDAMLEGIPFACIICKGPYKYPILTKCGHYFCEPCALQRFKKTPSCAACGAGTGGVFNGAKNLKKLLDKKRERAAKARQKAIENGEKVSDEADIEDSGNEDTGE